MRPAFFILQVLVSMRYLPPGEIIVLLENSLDPDGTSWLYQDPEDIITCAAPADVEACIAALQSAVDGGAYVAGFFSYEMGYLLEPGLRHLLPEDRPQPLLWFGVFDRRDRLDKNQLEDFWLERCRGRVGALGPLSADISKADYLAGIGAIKEHLAAGDVYQINYTFGLEGQAAGDPACVHAALRQAQPVGWGAYIETSDWLFSSHSPELFLEKRGKTVRLRPMKGTISRGRWPEEDASQQQTLVEDEKSRAENLMIVDLERNDLSRIAEAGTVQVPQLFEAETYRSVVQLTSTVTGQVPEDTSISAVLQALFPCGSVTGAPKIKAMEVIRSLERGPRGIYTGAIGHVAPGGDMVFNVPIRTLAIDHNGKARLGVGSGVVADSDEQAEYEESLLKGRFAEVPQRAPALIETMRWVADEGLWLLEAHLERLSSSAEYFGYALDLEEARTMLTDHISALPELYDGPPEDRRVRLLCSPQGELSIKSVPVSGRLTRSLQAALSQEPEHVAFASEAVCSDDVFLFHKTTHRQQLDRLHAREAAPRGYRDVLLVNEWGQVTEGTRYNLLVYLDGSWVTPPLSCGALGGTFRTDFMENGDSPLIERILEKEEVMRAEKICLANSLFGLIAVEVVE